MSEEFQTLSSAVSKNSKQADTRKISASCRNTNPRSRTFYVTPLQLLSQHNATQHVIKLLPLLPANQHKSSITTGGPQIEFPVWCLREVKDRQLCKTAAERSQQSWRFVARKGRSVVKKVVQCQEFQLQFDVAIFDILPSPPLLSVPILFFYVWGGDRVVLEFL